MLTREEEVWLRAYCAVIGRGYQSQSDSPHAVGEAEKALELFRDRFKSQETDYRGNPIQPKE